LKATGMVRKVDSLGRVVIPREICKIQGIELSKTALEVFIAGDTIILRRYQPGCTFCGSMDGLKLFGGKRVCEHCRAEIRKALGEGL
jgi:transcriptional pleiotropic regulator of transition state genes